MEFKSGFKGLKCAEVAQYFTEQKRRTKYSVSQKTKNITRCS